MDRCENILITRNENVKKVEIKLLFIHWIDDFQPTTFEKQGHCQRPYNQPNTMRDKFSNTR